MPKPTITSAQLQAMVDGFPWAQYQDTLRPGLTQVARDIVLVGGEAGALAAGGTWSDDNPFVSKFVNGYVGERIVAIDDTTKAIVVNTLKDIYENAEDDTTVTEIASAVSNAVLDAFETMEGYRSLMIARTETAILTNNGKNMGYSAAGVSEVDVLDGTDDEECESANGDVWSVEDAMDDPIAHPNCVRAFAPRVPTSDEEKRLGLEQHAATDWATRAIAVARKTRNLWSKPDPCPHRAPDPLGVQAA
jgi:hypothetical protein